MSKRLVINADDLGLVESVNRGIVETIKHGIVTSASLMVNMPGFDHGIQSLHTLNASGKRYGVGLHFNIVAGRPLTPCESLLRATGDFLSLSALATRALLRRVRAADVQRELDAQVSKAGEAIAAMGLRLTHIDSHRHAHCLPLVYDVTTRTARRLGIPHVRWPYETALIRRPVAALASLALRIMLSSLKPYDHIAFTGFGAMASQSFEPDVAALVESLPDGTTELMVHPGYDSPELGGIDPYRAPRETELRALTSERLASRIRRLGVTLVPFGD